MGQGKRLVRTAASCRGISAETVPSPEAWRSRILPSQGTACNQPGHQYIPDSCRVSSWAGMWSAQSVTPPQSMYTFSYLCIQYAEYNGSGNGSEGHLTANMVSDCFNVKPNPPEAASAITGGLYKGSHHKIVTIKSYTMTMDQECKTPAASRDRFFPNITSFSASDVFSAIADIYLSPSVMLSSVLHSCPLFPYKSVSSTSSRQM